MSPARRDFVRWILQLSFLKLCHAQTCGKCVPCRIGLGQLQNLLEQVLDGTATMDTLALIEETANNITDSADCAIGFEAAHMVLAGLQGIRDDYIYHIEHGKCSYSITQPVPCVALCPAGVDIPGYIALVGEERYADAVSLIRKDNPFPTACALICEHPCEARCRRNMIDSSVNIRGLKRMAVDNARANTVPVPAKGALHRKADRHCRRRPGRPFRGLLSGADGASCGGVRAEKPAGRHAALRHSQLPFPQGTAG